MGPTANWANFTVKSSTTPALCSDERGVILRAFMALLFFCALPAGADGLLTIDPEDAATRFFMTQPGLLTQPELPDSCSPEEESAWYQFIDRYTAHLFEITGTRGRPRVRIVRRDAAPYLHCVEYLAATPPPYLRAAIPNASSRLPGWWPLCSLQDSYYATYQRIPSRSDFLTSMGIAARTLDICGSAEDRHSSTFAARVDPAALRPPPAAYRQSLRAAFNDARAAVSESCCGDDGGCHDFFDRSQVHTCSEYEDPVLRHRCAAMGAWNDSQFEENAVRRSFGDPEYFLATGHRPLHLLGTPLPTPESHIYFNQVTDPPETFGQTMLHELGHSCSAYWATQAGRIGVRDSERLWYDRFMNSHAPEFPVYGRTDLETLFLNIGRQPTSWRSCRYEMRHRDFYQQLGQRLGMSTEVFRCIETLAASAPLMRFDPSQTCANGCALSMIEEAVAQWLQLTLTPTPHGIPASRAYVATMFDSCQVPRDGGHPLQRDVLACALLDDGFRARIASALESVGMCTNP